MTARDVPINLYKGANDPAVVWEFVDENAAPGTLADAYDLVVKYSGGVLTANTADGTLILDRTDASVTWPHTVTEIAPLPKGSGARYDLFGTTGGKRRPWAGGVVVVDGWTA